MLSVAVDWSGRTTGAANSIWTAIVEGGLLRSLECGRGREATIDHLLDLASDDTVIGLDFAFAFPAWFTRSLGASTGDELWARVARDGEAWLAAGTPPFWGRKGTTRPEGDVAFRRTELELRVAGIRPKSVFQINGAGTVGTGSVRGMPQLARLREGGYAIWPFHGGTAPVVIEMWPRLLTGPVVKSSFPARQAHLAQRYPDLDPTMAVLAASTDDAFDAAVSALEMDRHRRALRSLEGPRDQVDEIEGRVWAPVTT